MPIKLLATLFLLLFPLGTLLCAADRSEFLVYVMKSEDAVAQSRSVFRRMRVCCSAGRKWRSWIGRTRRFC